VVSPPLENVANLYPCATRSM